MLDGRGRNSLYGIVIGLCLVLSGFMMFKFYPVAQEHQGLSTRRGMNPFFRSGGHG